MIRKINLTLKEFIIILFLFVLIFTFYISESLKPGSNLRITFFNVGQGDSTFIQTPSNAKILIDGGVDNKVLNHLGKKLSFADNNIDIVIATHDDADHIFGLIKVMEKYNVKVFITSVPNSSNNLMQELIKIAESKNIKIIQIKSQGEIKFSDNVKINFLFPTTNLDKIEDGNSASVVSQIIYGNKKILLTGDLGINGENYLISKYGNILDQQKQYFLESDILKLGHHGSNTSSGPNFLKSVKPSLAIISAGENNKFGHPHESVTNLLNKFGIKYLETAKEGNIKFVTNGLEIWQE